MTPDHKASRHKTYALMGHLSRSIGHDLRNPLGLITQAAYLLKLQIEEGDPQALKTVEIIANAAGDIERVLDSLRGYVCAVPAEPEPYHVLDVLRSALVQLDIPENISHQVIAPEEIPMMLVDGDQLMAAFHILAGYCLHAMPDGGILTVSIALQDGLDIILAHSGPALNTEQVAALFDPFAVESPYKDGLILPLAQVLIEHQQGSISTTDGTNFLVHLPVIEPTIQKI